MEKNKYRNKDHYHEDKKKESRKFFPPTDCNRETCLFPRCANNCVIYAFWHPNEEDMLNSG